MFRPRRLMPLLAWMLAVIVNAAHAGDLVLSTTSPLVKHRKVSDRSGPADSVELAIFIPDGVKTIRGAVMNPFHLKSVEQRHWQEACRVWGFALIGANYFSVNKNELAPTLQAALDDFAKKSGHKELSHIPFCFVGMSAGGGMSREFAAQMPERTIAVAPVCLEVSPDLEQLRPIPFLNVFGEKDGGQMKLHLEKLPIARGAGAQWGIAVQWGRRHEFAQANNLVVPFFEDVIHQRLPDDADATGGVVKLKPSPAGEAWLGDVSNWAARSRFGLIAPARDNKTIPAEASWLPSARVAATWQSFVSADGALIISEPAGLGDKQPFVLHDDKPIRVVVDAKDANGAVALYDGDKRLAEKEKAPFEFEIQLKPGAHPLFATTGKVEKRVFSKPHTVIVRRR